MAAAAPAKANARPAARKPAATPVVAASATVIPFPVQSLEGGPRLQRKCACGGSCPKCLDPVQARLRVGPVDDPYEREADRIAEGLMGTAAGQPAVTGHAASTRGRPAPAGAAPRDREGPGSSPPAAASREPTPTALSTGGSPLPEPVRAFFEPRLSRDLSAVRVHAGREAEAFTDHFDAHAFTLGHHVWFGRGQRPQADFLTAHELAHVVQQRQLQVSQQVQRLGRALFWIPLDAKGAMTGTDIHKELIDEAVGKNKQLDNEAPAPNADLNGWGLGHQGRIDIYRGKHGAKFHVMAGVTWGNAQNIPVGSQSDDPLAAIPREHFQARIKESKGTIAPKMDGSKVVDIAKGPTEVAVGELKPATSEILDKGAGQLTNYREGMAHSARLANAWAKMTTATGKTAPEWKLGTPTNLAQSDVQFKPEHVFDPNNLRGDRNLVLGKVSEGGGATGQKYKVSIEYNPALKGQPPIKGGLYAMPAGKPGLWMYFSRPQDLNAVLTRARGNLGVQGNFILANRIQDEVIVPLLKAPEKVNKFDRARSEPPAGTAPAAAPATAPAATPDAPRLRRKQRTSPKLKDTFDLKKWQKAQGDLRGEANPKTEPAKGNLESLEFLHQAYDAEEALDALPGTGKSKLPPKSKDMVKAGTDPKTAKSHPLANIIHWARGWTGRAAGVLGILRNTFGDTFVFAANKFIEIRDAVRKKVKGFLDKRNASLGSGTVGIIVRAIFRALKAVLQVTLHQTAHYIVNKVEAGIVRKLKTFFDFDPIELLKEELEQTLNQYLQPLVDLKNKVTGFFDDTVKSITENFGWIEDLKDLADKASPIIEAAVIALQCLTPPGWGCLKMLLRKLQNWAIEKVLGFCDVKKAIADLIAMVPFVGGLSKWLGDKALGLIQAIVPTPFKDIFDTDTAVPPKDDVACDDDQDPDEPPPTQEQLKGTAGSLETLQQLNELKKEQGDDRTQAVADLVGKSGIPDTTPLTADQVKALREKLKAINPTAKELQDLAQGQASDETRKKLAPLKDYLDGVAGKGRQDKLDQIAKDLRAGKYDADFKQLAARKRSWEFVETPALGMPFTGMQVLMVDGTQRAAGIIDGLVGPCDAKGEVEVTITRADLRDAAKPDQPVTIQLPVKGPMEGLCGKPGTPPGGPAPKPLPPPEGAPPPVAQGPGTGGKAGAPPAGGAPGGGGGGGTQGTGGQGGGSGPGSGAGAGATGSTSNAGKPGKPAPKGKITVKDVIAAGPGGTPGGGQGGAFDGFFDFCADVLQCPASATQVTFEAEDEKALGLRAVRSDLGRLPGSAGSLQRARNPRGPLTLKDLGDGTFDVFMLDDDDKPHLVGKARKSTDKAGDYELISGAILTQLQAAAKKWERRFNVPAAQSRSSKIRI